MTRRRMSPRSSGSLRRTAGDVVALATVLSWTGVRIALDGVRSVTDRVASSIVSRVVGSEAIDPRVFDWTFSRVVSS